MWDAVVSKKTGEQESDYVSRQDKHYHEDDSGQQSVKKGQKGTHGNDDRSHLREAFSPLSESRCDNKMSEKNSKKLHTVFPLGDIKTVLLVFVFFISYLTSAVLLGTGQYWLWSVVAALPAVVVAAKDFSVYILPDVWLGVILVLIWIGFVLTL